MATEAISPGKPPTAAKPEKTGEKPKKEEKKPASENETKLDVTQTKTECAAVSNGASDKVEGSSTSLTGKIYEKIKSGENKPASEKETKVFAPSVTVEIDKKSPAEKKPNTPISEKEAKPAVGENDVLRLNVSPLPDTDPNNLNTEKESITQYNYENKMWEELESVEMYHGAMPPDDVATILTKQGDFVLRKLEDRTEPVLAVTVCWDSELYHFPFYAKDVNGQKMYLLTPGRAFATPHEVIRHHQSGFVPVYQATQLINPIPKQAWELSRSNVITNEKIGEGAFGEVWKGDLTIRKPDEIIKQPVAVKLMKLDPKQEDQGAKLKKFQEEARLMRQLNHRNIVKLHGILFSDVDIMIVMELLMNGSLDKFLTKNKTIGPLTRASFSHDAAAGLAYLHSKKLMHRDIAARNCLVQDGRILKLSDFGMAAQGTKYIIPKEEKIPTRWQSPEVIFHRTYYRESDVWSYGMLVLEIHTAQVPFVGIKTAVIREKLGQSSFRPALDFIAKPEITALLEKCWILEPAKRPLMSVVEATLKPYCVHSIQPLVKGKLINQGSAIKKTPPIKPLSKKNEEKTPKSKAGKVQEKKKSISRMIKPTAPKPAKDKASVMEKLPVKPSRQRKTTKSETPKSRSKDKT